MKDKFNGWINTSGKFITCKIGEHIIVHPYNRLFEKWIKITSYTSGHIFVNTEPTQAQINTVYSWCEINRRNDLWEHFKEIWMD